ncbi:glutamine amidotransferase [Demequina sp. SYSU T00039]|uniref:Glutamine amidotransferase n=1 Tax=Demequina lignilytica TaxID=3051663 RepID=A0AAW7M3Z7_9MICO|nr:MULTISPECIES: glutamine amidotransferase [unclassified Demequina]MDN4478168.1 glutamine amidotransferase [Demequina sp. SYSU T00039-1]MDN4488382.1 glutamine amidotransferase [Demequina sp. SYSU T00039]
MTLRCDVIRFVAFEDLGVWEPELRAHGYEVRYLDAGVDDVTEASGAELAIVLGAPIDAPDSAGYPVLDQVRAVLAARRDRPTVGVCLGAQLMALVAGASVLPGAREVGFAPVEVTEAGRRGPLRALDCAPVLHWHADTFTLPDGAVLLASTAANRNQAFALGPWLAVQFHPEADPEAIERWLIGHTGDLRAWGIDPRELRQAARDHGDAAAMGGVQVIREYVRAL